MGRRSSLGESLVGRAYLLVYNSVQFLCWSCLLGQFLVELKSLEFNNRRLWSNVELPLLIFQTVQLAEVLHCIVGLVPSNPFITFIQIITKVLICWGIVTPFHEPKHSIGIFIVTGCWSLAEITRYLYYVLSILNSMPYLLIWCRYSFFMALYPIGVFGELLIIKSSLNEISKNPYLSFPLPNFLNFSFYLHVFLMIVMFLYIPLFPPMFNHLLNQRRKVIGSVSTKPQNLQK